MDLYSGGRWIKINPAPKAVRASGNLRLWFRVRMGPAVASCDLLSNYLRVLLRIGQDPNLRIRDLAAMLGLTERAIQHIVEHLEADGYLSHSHIGRRNTYTIYREMLIDELGLSVGELLDLVARQRSTPAWKTVLVQPVSPRRSLPKAQR